MLAFFVGGLKLTYKSLEEQRKQGSRMKYRALIPSILLVIIFLVLSNNQAEVSITLESVDLTQQPPQTADSTEKIQEEKLSSVVSSPSQSKIQASQLQVEDPENKQEQTELLQMGIEHSMKLVDMDSELHKKLLEQLRKNIPDYQSQKTRGTEFAVDLEGRIFSTYSGDKGIEFYEENIDWHKQLFDGISDHFKKIQELQAQELEELGDWNANNESIIYQLVEGYNYVSFEEYGLPKVSPVNVDCRGNVCSVHFSHPNNAFNRSGEEVHADNLKAIMAFRLFFKARRSWCKCIGFEYFSEGWNESSFRFVFD